MPWYWFIYPELSGFKCFPSDSDTELGLRSTALYILFCMYFYIFHDFFRSPKTPEMKQFSIQPRSDVLTHFAPRFMSTRSCVSLWAFRDQPYKCSHEVMTIPSRTQSTLFALSLHHHLLCRRILPWPSKLPASEPQAFSFVLFPLGFFLFLSSLLLFHFSLPSCFQALSPWLSSFLLDNFIACFSSHCFSFVEMSTRWLSV